MRRPRRLLTTAVVIGGSLALLGTLERRYPLRRRVESQPIRSGRNATIGLLALLASTVLQRVIGTPAQRWSRNRRTGVVRALGVPSPLDTIASIALLDYTLWLWHWSNHKVPLLWRFHLVHHIDLDLDASSALRFHFGEMALSVLFRAVQVGLVGPTETALAVWQQALFISVLFHHSNLRLDPRIERFLAPLVVTPEMHGVHHSTRAGDTNSNWSSLLSVWDRLHGTYRMDRSQEAIVIGVPAWQDPAEVTVGRMLALPFEGQRDDWRSGTSPQ